ncbi:MAG TPA: hypothetical protein VIU93_07590 [Gallionellaceae bacterium]
MSNLVAQSLSLVGIGFFLFFAFDGVFRGGGSNSVFVGVAILSSVIAAGKIIEKLMRN